MDQERASCSRIHATRIPSSTSTNESLEEGTHDQSVALYSNTLKYTHSAQAFRRTKKPFGTHIGEFDVDAAEVVGPTASCKNINAIENLSKGYQEPRSLLPSDRA